MATEKNYFQTLFDIDVTDKIREKNGLTYLSWAWAWSELKKRFPTATSRVYETEDGRIYFTDGKTCWVKVSVTVNDVEHVEYLPVMDFRNKSIPVENITSTDVNKSIQRALTKAIARHGLGLYIYAGEDLPETVSELEELGEENLKLSVTLAKQSDELKTKVGAIVREYLPNKKNANPKAITDIEQARELNRRLKEL